MDAVTEVLARDDERIAAMLAADGAALEEILAADYTHAHNNGLLEDRAAYLASVVGGPVRYQRFAPRERVVRVYGATALLTGLSSVAVLYEGRPIEIEVRFLAVYLRQADGWRIAAWQATPLPAS